MTIKVNDFHDSEYESIEEYARQKLDGDYYEAGRLEATERTAENNSEAIGRLLTVLHGRGVISDEDVTRVIDCVPCGFVNDEM